MTLPTSKNGAHSKQIGNVHFDYRLKVMSLLIMLRLGKLYYSRKATLSCFCNPWHRSYRGCLHYTRPTNLRWLSVHIRDMMSLLVNYPNIRSELRAGKIGVHKTSSKFLAMTIDQCHEQDNGAVKVSARCPKTVAVPEVGR